MKRLASIKHRLKLLFALAATGVLASWVFSLPALAPLPGAQPNLSAALAAALGPDHAWAAAYTVDVTSRGAKGNGTTDDSPAFQAAVDALVNTGGVIWVPPNRAYALGSKITIKSKYSIWFKSGMQGRGLGGGGATTHGGKGLIRPLNNLSYLFEWDRPAGLLVDEGGGGGLAGINIADWVMPSTGRSKKLDGAVNIIAAATWHCHDCTFEHLNGRAIRVGSTNYCNIRGVKIYHCGAVNKPPLDIDGFGGFGQVWMDRGFLENNQLGAAQVVRVNRNCNFNAEGVYFENTTGKPSVFIDATEGGHIGFENCTFNGNDTTSVIVGGEYSALRNSEFYNFPGALPAIKILAGGFGTQLQNLRLRTPGSTGIAIDCQTSFVQMNDLYLLGGGRIDVTAGADCLLSDIYMYVPDAAAGSYAIDLGDNELNGGLIRGGGLSVCHGVRTANGSVRSFKVTELDDANGFTATGAGAQLVGNRASSLGSGVPFTYASGAVAFGNSGDTGKR